MCAAAERYRTGPLSYSFIVLLKSMSQFPNLQARLPHALPSGDPLVLPLLRTALASQGTPLVADVPSRGSYLDTRHQSATCVTYKSVCTHMHTVHAYPSFA